MSIKLNVYPWCENCSDFSPEVQVQHGYDTYGIHVLCNTTITCKNEHRCTEIKKYLESEMKLDIRIEKLKKENKDEIHN